MAFLYPNFFWALAVLAIPIAVHLFNFRRYKRILFTNVRFLKEVNEETRSQQKLKHLLVLLMRLLALALLVAAFAQPYFPGSQKVQTGVSTVAGFYLDNSFSMNADAEEGLLLEVGKNKIREALKAYKSNDRFFLITNNSLVGSSHLLTKEEINQRLDDVDFASSQLTSGQVIQRAAAHFAKASQNNRELFFVSDMQSSLLQFSEGQRADTSFNLYTLPVQSERPSNLAIDSVWFGTPVIKPEESVAVNITVVNYGKENAGAVSVTLMLDGVQKAAGVVDVDAGTRKSLTLDLLVKETGWHQAEVKIQDNPVVFDDRYFISFPVKKEVKITGIYQDKSDGFVSRLFSTDDYYRYVAQQVNQVDYTSLKSYDFIVLDGLDKVSTGLAAEITAALNRGAGVLFVPPAKADLNTGDWSGWLKSYGVSGVSKSTPGSYKVNNLLTKDALFANVFEKIPRNMDFPNATQYYRYAGAGNARVLLGFANGDPMLTVQESGYGKLFVSAVPFSDDWTNFHRHALFVPMVMRMSYYNMREFPLSAEVGSNRLIKVSSTLQKKEGNLRLSKEKFEILPEFYVRDNESYISDAGQISEAGIYLLSDGKESQPVAFNYNRNESSLRFADAEMVQKHFEGFKLTSLTIGKSPLGETLKKGRMGTPLWKWCIMGVLLFLLFEILLLRLWKNNPGKKTIIQNA